MLKARHYNQSAARNLGSGGGGVKKKGQSTGRPYVILSLWYRHEIGKANQNVPKLNLQQNPGRKTFV